MKRKLMEKAKKLLCLVLVLIFAVSAAVFSEPEQVRAAEGPIKFEDDKTYTQYDVTGDGKADTFKYDFVYGRYFSLYLNGKFIQQIDAAKGVQIYLWQYSRSRVYLLVFYFSSLGSKTPSVYQYSKSKNEFVCIDDSIGNTTLSHSELKGIPRKTLCLETSSNGRLLDTFKNAEYPLFTCIAKYKFSGNKLKPFSRYLRVTGKEYFTAVNSFDTKATKKLTGRGPSVRAGDKVQLLGVYLAPTKVFHECRYKIKTGGKTGWFQDSEMCQLK